MNPRFVPACIGSGSAATLPLTNHQSRALHAGEGAGNCVAERAFVVQSGGCLRANRRAGQGRRADRVGARRERARTKGPSVLAVALGLAVMTASVGIAAPPPAVVAMRPPAVVAVVHADDSALAARLAQQQVAISAMQARLDKLEAQRGAARTGGQKPRAQAPLPHPLATPRPAFPQSLQAAPARARVLAASLASQSPPANFKGSATALAGLPPPLPGGDQTQPAQLLARISALTDRVNELTAALKNDEAALGALNAYVDTLHADLQDSASGLAAFEGGTTNTLSVLQEGVWEDGRGTDETFSFACWVAQSAGVNPQGAAEISANESQHCPP